MLDRPFPPDNTDGSTLDQFQVEYKISFIYKHWDLES